MHPSLIVGLVGLILCAPARAATTQPAPEFTDAEHSFTIHASAPWHRSPQLEKSAKAMVLGLAYGEGRSAKMAPLIEVLTVSGGNDASLDDVAQSMLDKAKQTHPRQPADAVIEKTTLDGEDARQIVYIMDRGHASAHVKAVLAKHKDKLYIVEFQAEDSEYTQRASLSEPVFKSFKWTGKQGG